MADPINLAGDIYDTRASMILDEFLPRRVLAGYVEANLRDAIAAAIRAAQAETAQICAGIARGQATCGCNGQHGSCNINDSPLAVAAAIEARFPPLATGGQADPDSGKDG